MPTRSYFGCRLSQRGKGNSIDFFIFVASIKDIAQWSGVRRVGKHDKGNQRILKDARVHQISRFFRVDQRNTIPVSMTLAFNPGKTKFISLQDGVTDLVNTIDLLSLVENKVVWGILRFDFEEGVDEDLRPALIVDGQHRLKGMMEFAEKDNENLPALVVALIDASPEEQAFQFVVINKKADKVPTNNVKAIIASINEADLQSRLLKAGVDYGNISAMLKDVNEREDSPFKGLLIWPLDTNNSGQVQLTAIEACLRYIRGTIRDLEDDEDTTYEVFLSLWQTVKERYADLWANNKLFMSKVNINALNEYVVDKLANSWENTNIDIYDMDDVKAQTKAVLKPIPSDLWKMRWSIRIQDNSVVRDIIKEDLRTVLQNARSRKQPNWFDGLQVLRDSGDQSE